MNLELCAAVAAILEAQAFELVLALTLKAVIYFTAHMCTGSILSNYKLFVNPLFKLISVEHVIIGSKTQWKTT